MLGLCLEGGGAKGAFHIGAISALLDRGFVFDGVTGTSIGAVIGGALAQGDFIELREKWKDITVTDLIDIDGTKASNLFNGVWDKNDIKYGAGLIWQFIKNGGIPIDKAQDYLFAHLDETKIRNSKTDFGIVTILVTDKTRTLSEKFKPIELFKEEIPEGQLLDYILASAYFPAFKRKNLSDGRKYLDGGLYNNLPLNMLARKGYDRIIAIRTGSRMPHKTVAHDNVRVDYINPSEFLGRVFTFTKENIHHNMTMGYFDALRYIDDLSGVKYYVSKLSDSEFAQYAIDNFPVAFWEEEGFAKEAQMSDYANLISTTFKPCFGVYDAFLCVLEAVAEKLGLGRFKVRTFEEFVKDISELCKIRAIYDLCIFLRNDKIPYNIINRIQKLIV
ncbi:MAG: patatin-like phospholipase family protein [Christensenellaceae bacterium]|jgi:NTE family protein|nr:patatin-like phospholipase family protein [Christensenellaceae bacterium]